MMNQLTLTLPVVNGTIQLTDQQKQAVDSFLSKLERVEVRWAKPGSVRSLDQNRLYWRVLTIIAQATGNETEALHEHFKATLLPRMFVELGGKTFEIAKTTTKMPPKEFGEYITKVIATAGEYGVYIPESELRS